MVERCALKFVPAIGRKGFLKMIRENAEGLGSESRVCHVDARLDMVGEVGSFNKRVRNLLGLLLKR